MKDARLSITIHKISTESKLKFHALRFTLEKPEYVIFDEIVDLYWRNLDKTASPQKRNVLARKFLDLMNRIWEGKDQ